MEYTEFQNKGGYFVSEILLIKVVGDKAAEFLHGQFTNHIKALSENEGNYNLLLNQKGKVQADLHVFRKNNEFYLLVHKNFAQLIWDRLMLLAGLSRVELKDDTDNFIIIHSTHPIDGVLSFQNNRLGYSGWDLVVPLHQKEIVLKKLEEKELVLMIPELQETLRIENGICKVGLDADQNNLPQECRLDGALHFEKGCYLGQEVIARLHFKGHVNKVLVGLKSEHALKSSDIIYDDEKSVGKISSGIFSEKLQCYLGLGYVPYKKSELGSEFLVGDKQVKAEIALMRCHPATSTK